METKTNQPIAPINFYPEFAYLDDMTDLVIPDTVRVSRKLVECVDPDNSEHRRAIIRRFVACEGVDGKTYLYDMVAKGLLFPKARKNREEKQSVQIRVRKGHYVTATPAQVIKIKRGDKHIEREGRDQFAMLDHHLDDSNTFESARSIPGYLNGALKRYEGRPQDIYYDTKNGSARITWRGTTYTVLLPEGWRSMSSIARANYKRWAIGEIIRANPRIFRVIALYEPTRADGINWHFDGNSHRKVA